MAAVLRSFWCGEDCSPDFLKTPDYSQTAKTPRTRRSKSATQRYAENKLRTEGTGDGLSKTKTNFGSPGAGEDEGLRSLHGVRGTSIE